MGNGVDFRHRFRRFTQNDYLIQDGVPNRSVGVEYIPPSRDVSLNRPRGFQHVPQSINGYIARVRH